MESNVAALLSRLSKISPMPEDDLMPPALIAIYQEIVSELAQLRDPACIRPLIDSFGYGEADGAYWSALHLLEWFPTEIVVPELIAALDSRMAGPCQWAAFMLGRTRYRESVPHLLRLLDHEKPLVRASAVMAVAMIGSTEGLAAIEPLRNDPAPEVRNEVRRALSQRSE